MMSDVKQRDEILDDLYMEVDRTIRYLRGMLEQIANDDYGVREITGDIDFMENNEILGLLEEARKIKKSEKEEVDVWKHYGE